MATASLARLRDAVLEAGVAHNASATDKQAVYEALAAARELITGGRL